MDSAADHFFVITGGPGSGKSTVVAALRHAGFSTSEEVGRRIIKEQMRIEGQALPWTDPLLFAETMLARDMQSYDAQVAVQEHVFFDRGVPDVIGYLRLLGLAVPPHMERAVDLFRYNRRVLIAPPWPEIFEQDSERKQTFDEACRTYDALVATYGALGYDLIELPRAPVDARLRFILENMR